MMMTVAIFLLLFGTGSNTDDLVLLLYLAEVVAGRNNKFWKGKGRVPVLTE
jgi:hypothetical protein